jgi:uncharacterized protein (TIGR03437 family)
MICQRSLHGIFLAGCLALASSAVQVASSVSSSRIAALDAYGKLPLSFEANQGQAGPEVRYLARGDGYAILLADSGAIVSLRSKGNSHDDVVRLELMGASSDLTASAAEPLPGRVNYFVGRGPSDWRRNIPTYARVQYRGVYPGVDLVYYGNRRQLEYDFVVSPHADPSRIRLRFAGARRVRLNRDGSLTVIGRRGEIVFHAPTIYQERSGERPAPVDGRLVLFRDNTAGFALGRYDRDRTLVIDPVLAYATYLGGGNRETGAAIAVDSSGSAYVTGQASSANFPTTAGAYEPTKPPMAGSSAFVTKLNPDGTALVYSTYLGGAGLGVADRGTGIAVDTAGNAWVTGVANSTDFPVTSGALKSSGPGLFVTKLNATGTGLVFSTYLNGLPATGIEDAAIPAIALDTTGNAYVTGTGAKDPGTPGAFQTTNHGGNSFITKLGSSGKEIYYTYLGGSSEDITTAIAADPAGNAYVTGETLSKDFPVTPGAFQSATKALGTVFVSKINPAGSALVYSTYLGGSKEDVGWGIAIDAGGNAYIVGGASSPDFPYTVGAFQGSSNAQGGSFIAKLNPTGTALGYAAFLFKETDSANRAGSIAVDGVGNTYVTGEACCGWPNTQDAFQPHTVNGGGFLTILNAAGNGLLYSSFLGGLIGDSGSAVTLDSGGNAYIIGSAHSANFPVTPGAFQPKNGSPSSNAFIVKFTSGLFSTANAATYLPGQPLAPDSIATSFGVHLSSPNPDGTQGTTINIVDSTGATIPITTLFYVSPTQINFLVPAGVATGTAEIQVVAADGTRTAGPIRIATVAPGIVTADGKLAVGAAIHVDPQGNQTSQLIAQYDSATKTFSAVPIHLDQVESPGSATYLTLYGTGIRNAPLSQVKINMGGQTISPVYAGAQGQFPGEDQINFTIPKALANAGDVTITLTAAGVTSNTVHVTIQ